MFNGNYFTLCVSVVMTPVGSSTTTFLYQGMLRAEAEKLLGETGFEKDPDTLLWWNTGGTRSYNAWIRPILPREAMTGPEVRLGYLAELGINTPRVYGKVMDTPLEHFEGDTNANLMGILLIALEGVEDAWRIYDREPSRDQLVHQVALRTNMSDVFLWQLLKLTRQTSQTGVGDDSLQMVANVLMKGTLTPENIGEKLYATRPEALLSKV